MLSVISPFRPRPVFGLLSVSLIFSLCLVCSPTPFLCFFLSSSQALGKPKTLWFGFPLVFLHPGRALCPRPVLLHLHLHQGLAQPLFCVFFIRRSRGLFLFFPRCLVLLFGGLSTRFTPLDLCFACSSIMRSLSLRGRETIISPRFFMIIAIIFWGEWMKTSGTATVLSHSCCGLFPRFEGGNVVLHFFCVWFGVAFLFFAVFLFLGSLSGFRGRTFVFGGLCWFCFFW